MIHTIKVIDYKNAKFTAEELQDYFNKVGMPYIEVKDKVVAECDEIIANAEFEDGLMKFMKLEEKYPNAKETIASKIDVFIKKHH